MTITAKFASICPCCNVRITPGAKVEWTKGSPARHVTCGAASTTTTTSYARKVAGPGRRTGCSCGSREDGNGNLISSGRNCSSCNHDA